MAALILTLPTIESWSLGLNAAFAALYGLSLALVLRWLPARTSAGPASVG